MNVVRLPAALDLRTATFSPQTSSRSSRTGIFAGTRDARDRETLPAKLAVRPIFAFADFSCVNAFRKDCFGATPKPARVTRALPETAMGARVGQIATRRDEILLVRNFWANKQMVRARKPFWDDTAVVSSVRRCCHFHLSVHGGFGLLPLCPRLTGSLRRF
jgi:hypothetical protein